MNTITQLLLSCSIIKVNTHLTPNKKKLRGIGKKNPQKEAHGPYCSSEKQSNISFQILKYEGLFKYHGTINKN